MKYVMGMALLLLALAIPGVNFYHNLSLPEVKDDKISVRYDVNFAFPFVHKIYHISLGNEIKSKGLSYYHTLETLRQAGKNDTVIFHLSGYGGDAHTTSLIMDGVKASKAHIVMITEAPVYSGHAYIALSGHKLIMRPYSFLMLHFSSVLNHDCKEETGYDRGVSNVEHCNALKNALVTQCVQMLSDLPLLTSEEKQQIITGHDVYIFPEDIKGRQ